MKNLLLYISTILILTVTSTAQICDELGSYNEVWIKQARTREENREERAKYYKTLTSEELARVSDIEVYPNNLMTCGMGYSNGLAKILVKGKAGFIDTKGKIVINPIFNDAGRFSENLAPVENKNGKWGFIDKLGKTVIDPQFDWALVFREGLALVQIEKKWGFVDQTGKFIIKPQFDHANSFSEGLAHVQIYEDKYYSGYIDKTGKWIIKPKFGGGSDFYKGKAIVDEDVKDKNGNYKYTTCYLINKTGKKLEELEDCSRTIQYPNLLDVTNINLFFDGYKTGYKVKSGKIIWEPTK